MIGKFVKFVTSLIENTAQENRTVFEYDNMVLYGKEKQS